MVVAGYEAGKSGYEASSCCHVIFLQEMPYYGLSRGKVVSIPLKGEFQRVQVSPEVSRYAEIK